MKYSITFDLHERYKILIIIMLSRLKGVGHRTHETRSTREEIKYECCQVRWSVRGFAVGWANLLWYGWKVGWREIYTRYCNRESVTCDAYNTASQYSVLACSARIRIVLLRHCVSFFKTRYVWDRIFSTFNQDHFNLVLVFIITFFFRRTIDQCRISQSIIAIVKPILFLENLPDYIRFWKEHKFNSAGAVFCWIKI